MKIVFVPSGEYKSFYINSFLGLNHCDLLVFNFGVIYDYDVEKEKQNPLVLSELKFLSLALGCVVVAGVFKLENGVKIKSILVYDGKNLTLTEAHIGAKISIKGKVFFVADAESKIRHFNKIILSKRRIYPRIQSCDIHKIYLFCDNFGVSLVQNKKIKRKFNKFPKIILN